MRNANRDKSNLERFGCTFKERARVFDIDWKRRRAAQASSANIFACLVHVRTKTGPIVLLAFEISSVRPLPNYCYFPFDLKRKGHRDYLSRLAKTGEIRLSLLTDKGTRKRTHRLTPYLRSRASEMYAGALQEYQTIEGGKYDFDSALQLMERHVRIPELLNRLLLDDSLNEISEKIKDAIPAVPNENRELAGGCVREAAEALLPYYENNRRSFLENLDHGRKGLTYIIDFHRFFADRPPGSLTRFVSDALAATLSTRELEGLRELVRLGAALSKLPFKEQSSTAPESTTTIPELPPGLSALVQSMTASGISKDTASRFFGLIGLGGGGKPGRRAKDYSREYELKASKSWTEVARQSISENVEIREEFGGRDFESLSFEERENLKNRIREGVRSYAVRTGKPFPIESDKLKDDPDKPAGK